MSILDFVFCTVDIGNALIECPTDGGEMEVEGNKGTITCPPFYRVCTSKKYIANPIQAALEHITNIDIVNFNIDDDANNDNKNGKNCSVSEILNNKCLDGQININQIDEIKNSLLTEDYNGENTIIETETVIIQLSKLEDQANQDNVNISNKNMLVKKVG